jgi:uncharacterized membrane protein
MLIGSLAATALSATFLSRSWSYCHACATVLRPHYVCRAALTCSVKRSAAMMYFNGYPPQWGWMVLGAVATIVFCIAAIWAVAWTVAIAMQHRTPPALRESDALEILGRRYAASALDDVEYERRRHVLRSSS